MKKLLALLILLFLIVNVGSSQTGWVLYKADDRVSIKFPSEPTEIIPGTFSSTAKDSSAVFVLTVVDFMKASGVDSTMLEPVKRTPAFTSQIKTGLGQSLPDVVFEDFKISDWKGYTKYTSTGVDSDKKIYSIFMLLIGNKLYSLSTIINDGGNTKDRDMFFSSVMLNH